MLERKSEVKPVVGMQSKARYPFLKAVTEGDLPTVRTFLDQNKVIQRILDDALMDAAMNNKNVDVARELIKNGAHVNRPPSEFKDMGDTALAAACAVGNIKMVEMLLKKKANIDSENNKAMTPLHVAVLGNHLDVVKLLLAKKASKINLQETDNGHTPLISAMQNGNKEIVCELLAHGAKVLVKGKKIVGIEKVTNIEITQLIKEMLRGAPKAQNLKKEIINAFFKNSFLINKEVVDIIQEYSIDPVDQGKIAVQEKGYHRCYSNYSK